MRVATRTALTFLLLMGVALGETKVLENFTLINGAGGSPVSNAALVVIDGRIDYAGPKTGMRAPVGAQPSAVVSIRQVALRTPASASATLFKANASPPPGVSRTI